MLRTSHHAPPTTRRINHRTFAIRALLGALVLVTTACQHPLDKVDRRVDRLLEDRSGTLGNDATPPVWEPNNIGRPTRSAVRETDPSTVNPPASDLRFDVAAEQADLADRLAAYSRLDPDAAPLEIGLPEALRLAQETGREYRNASEDYVLAAISLLIERHLWSPRLFNDTTVSVDGTSDDGRFEHAVGVVNSLRATKRLPFGGTVEARWLVAATDQLRDRATGGYVSSSELVLSADIPLLAGAGLAARADRIQAERDLVYASRTFERFRRSYLVEIAADYFDLLTAKAAIANQERQLASRRRADEETRAKVEAGRLRPFQRDITANAVRQSESRLATLRESYILQVERFKVRLGLDPRVPVEVLELDFDIPVPGATPNAAVDAALAFRLDLQNQRDGLVDAERDVAVARNQLLPDLDIDASVGFETDDDDATAGVGIRGDELDYSLGMTLGLPLDRRIERLGLRRAVIFRDRARRQYDQFRDSVVVDARAAVRRIDLARFTLELAREQIVINRRGLEDLNLRDDADPQSKLDRENDLLNAENARDEALSDLRSAILSYLLATGQLRVAPDGTFLPLPGMDQP